MKRLMGLILALVMCFSLPAFAANEEGSSPTVSERNAPMVIIGDQDNTYVMAGTHNSSLLVKSISSEEYMSMMSILYPNGVVDAQGQDISGVENTEIIRNQFIAEHMRAYSMIGHVKTEVQLTPFTITISDQSNGEYQPLFYKASIGQDTFVFPSEWGSQPFGFAHASDKGIYLAFFGKSILIPTVKSNLLLL